jgi:uncharacterized SAM-binding protein YcdF (DUF218 family)
MILAFCCLLFLVYRLCTLWPTRHQRTRTWWIGAVTALIAVVGIIVGVAQDIVAQKAVGLLLMPAGLAWMLLIAMTIGAWRSAARPLAVLASAALLLFTLAGNAWIGDALIGSLEQRIPPLEVERMQPFDAICVLGGGTEVSDADGPALSSGGDRIALAARLWHAGKTKVLVVSGGSISAMERERDLAQESAIILRNLGVDPRAIIQAPAGAVNTTQEIAAYGMLIREHEWKRVGLVSSAWHLPRALRLCRAAHLEVVPLGADRRGRFRGWSPYWLIPQDHGFDRMQRACWEYLGMLAGR